MRGTARDKNASYAPHPHVLLRIGADLVDGKIGTAMLVLGAEPQPQQLVDESVDDEAATAP